MSYLLAYNPYNTNLFMKTRSIDPAAQDFIDAAGITGDVQQQAINNLVKGLKADGIWSKMKAVYPFVTDNKNLFSYTEDLTNLAWQKLSVTVTSGELAPNNTNTAFKVKNDASAPYCLVRQTGLVSSPTAVLSFYVKKIDYDFIYIRGNSTAWYYVNLNTLATSNPNISISAIENNWFRVSLKNDVNIGWGQFGVGVAETDAAALGKSAIFWHPQLELGSTLTEYQPILTTQQAYIANQFKYNLKDPRDLDAAFRLVFNGGWTHSSNGATPNGTNGYANTYLTPSSVLTNNNYHLSHYSRTQNTATSSADLACIQGNTMLGIDQYYQYVSRKAFVCSDIVTNQILSNETNTRGLLVGSRTSSTSSKMFMNNAQSGSTLTLTNTSSLPTCPLYVSANNSNNSTVTDYSTKQTAFASVGDGLTDDDAAALYYHTQVFQTSLNRQIGSPAYAVPVVTDPNAKLYLSAIGSTTNSTFNTAIDTFIKGLKADGIYSKMKAIYPFATNNPNLLSYTENLSNASWSKDGCTIIANNTIAPDGSTTAWRITRINSGAQGFAIRQQNLPIVASTQYTFSVYLKAPNSSTTIQVDLGDGMPNPVITLTTEWQLYTFVRTLGGSGTFLDFNIGSGDGSYCWFWHPQLEIGSTATAYQAQLGSAQSYFANQFKYNMVNPQDDDSAFRLVFSGGWTHSPQGALPNGVNAYADTKLIPSSVLTLNSGHLSFYSRTNSQSGLDIGGQNDNQVPYAQMYLASRSSLDLLSVAISSTDATRAQSSNTSSLGLFLGSRISSTSLKSFKNGVLQATNTSASQNIQPNFSLVISALQYNPSPINYSNRQAAFSSIGDGLTDTEAANLFVRVETLNRALARQVVVPTVSDPDAQAFLINAVITDPTQATAINNLVVGLKADGLWDKMKAIYPFVGGTASTHKYNLKDPRDLDAAYRLVFSGGWTHDANGATPNGVNGYANTYFNPNTQLSFTNAHVSLYKNLGTISATDRANGVYDVGGNTVDFSINPDRNTTLYSQIGMGSYVIDSSVGGNSSVQGNGYYIGARNANNFIRLNKNNTNTLTNTTTSSPAAFPNDFVWLGGSHQVGQTTLIAPNNYRYAMFTMGEYLNATEAANLYTRVQNLQTLLNRQV